MASCHDWGGIELRPISFGRRAVIVVSPRPRRVLLLEVGVPLRLIFEWSPLPAAMIAFPGAAARISTYNLRKLLENAYRPASPRY